jgi:hypothetical protein
MALLNMLPAEAGSELTIAGSRESSTQSLLGGYDAVAIGMEQGIAELKVLGDSL